MEIAAPSQLKGTVGSVLDEFSKKIEAKLNEKTLSTEHVQPRTEIQIAQKIYLVIANMKNIYLKNYSDNFETANHILVENVNKLAAIIKEFETQKEIKPLNSRCLALISKVVGVSEQPLVRDISASRILINRENNAAVVVKFSGYFPLAGFSNFESKLSINDREITSSFESSESIEFQISDAVCPLQLDQFTPTQLKLAIPWRQSQFYGLSAVNKIDFLKLHLLFPPKCPGKIAVAYEENRVERVSKSHVRVCNAWAGDHFDKDNQTPVELEFSVCPDTGWAISTTKKPHVEVLNATGTYIAPSIQQITAEKVVSKISLSRCCANHLASVNYKVEFEQYKDVEIKNSRIEWITDLKWGEERKLNLDPKEKFSKATLFTFYGDTVEITEKSQNGCLLVKQSNGEYFLSAVITKEKA